MPTRMLIAIIISASAIVFAFWSVSLRGAPNAGVPEATATLEGGTQFIDITAKGGYSPRVVVAKAGIPTVVRVSTKGTFDCSSSVVIPKLSFQKFLQSTETVDIPLSAAQATGTLQGLCSMGMYNFQIRFQ